MNVSGELVDAIKPPTSAPRPMPRFMTTRCMAKAAGRCSGAVWPVMSVDCEGQKPPTPIPLTTATATPVVDQPWRYTVTVKSATGRPLAGQVKLEILAGSAVVGCWKGGAMVQCFSPAEGEWIPFKGRRSGTLRFPAASVGAKLTFQATVRAQRQVRRLRAPFTVKPAP